MQGRRKHADFQAEVEAHLRLEADRLREEGLSAAEAEMAARRSFGNRTRAEERFYEAGRWTFFDNLARDIRFAARMLLKDLRFSTLAVLGLALGIALSTAIFTLINASFQVNEAPQDPKSYIGLTRMVNGRPIGDFSYAEYVYYRDHGTTLRAVWAGSRRDRFLMGSDRGEAEEVKGRFLSGNFLSIHGMTPAIGRSFSTDEEQAGGAAVAVLDFRFWNRRFASDPGVLGKVVTLNAQRVTIIGVADKRQGMADTSDFYLPLAMQPLLLGRGDWLRDSSERWLSLDAKLQPGVSPKQAQAELEVLSRALQPQSSAGAPAEGAVTVTPGGGNPAKRAEIIAMMLAVTLAVSMILLIACSNLANLLLARAVVRQREIGVRLSLGASRARIVCQLLTESMLVALCGGALGLVFSQWLAKVLMSAANEAPGIALELRLEPAVVLYALVLSVATGLSFGLAPALTASRTSLSQALHAEGLVGSSRTRRSRIWSARNALVIVPLAASLMLLLGAGAALRRVQRGYLEGPAFDASRLVGAALRLNMQGYDRARTLKFQDDLRGRIASMPGVTSVTLAASMPLSNGIGWFPLAVDGSPVSSRNSDPNADYDVISANFFETLGVRITRGRGFTEEDREGTPPVALVNQELVRRYWPNEEPIGKRIRLREAQGNYFEVVGVAPDLQDANGPMSAVRPMVYVPFAQGSLFLRGLRPDPPPYQMQLLVHTTGDTAAAKNAIRQEAHATDASLRIDVQTIEEALEARLGPVKMVSMMLTGLSALALLMASIGIYAILSYAVSQRTREIGIRTALGAQRREILSLVMQRTMVLIAWGIGLGLFAALLLTRVFARNFAKFGELDLTTCVVVAAFLGGFAMLASYLPARKALRVDPVQALRYE